MKALFALPYRKPRIGLVSATPWTHTTASGVRPLPEVVADWDSLTLLQLSRRVSVAAEFRASCGLPAGAPIAVAVTWHASGSNLRDCAYSIEIPPEDDFECDIETELPGRELGGRLTLRTRVILEHGVPRTGRIHPHLAGSSLWEDEWVVRLEGDEPAFPITMLDFSQTLFDQNAEWHLEVSEDLAVAAMGGLRLYLNTLFAPVPAAFASAGNPDSTQRAILNSIKVDIQRLMALRALQIDRSVAWDEGSLGHLLLHRLEVVFGDRNPDSLAQLARDYPHEFDTTLRGELGPVFASKP